MATDPGFVEYLLDQIDEERGVSARKMFGEYGLHSHGTFFGLVCDDRLYLKRTDAGRAWIGTPTEAPAYPGAKPSFLVEELDDGPWLSELVRVTVEELEATGGRKKRRG